MAKGKKTGSVDEPEESGSDESQRPDNEPKQAQVLTPNGETPEILLDTSVSSAPEPLPTQPSLIAQLEAQALVFERRGDHLSNALLLSIVTHAGALRGIIQPALGKFTGDTAELIDRLYDAL